jgi:nucleoside 2-deoxyribosyltransferase
MKLYLAGPMTGYENLNFPHFHAVTALLRGQGHEVINPAEVNADPKAKWEDCMKADIRELVMCDGIALLDGWQKSRGAMLEHHIARALSLEVFCAYALTEAKAAA